jgi:hypothetical protein
MGLEEESLNFFRVIERISKTSKIVGEWEEANNYLSIKKSVVMDTFEL